MGSMRLPSGNGYALHELFQPPGTAPARQVVQSNLFTRTAWEITGSAVILLDQFADAPGSSCCFVRLSSGPPRTARFVVDGAHTIESCRSGGWLVRPVAEAGYSYWIPQSPVLRTIDAHARILSEHAASIVGVNASSAATTIEIEVADDAHLDCAFWRLSPDASDVVAALQRPLVLELQPVFMWGSHTAFRGPADVYRYLVHGHVYENRFEWRYKWKVCAENEAYSLYLALQGLESASGKRLYGLLKQQVLFSVIARQSTDGGWHHGEWSDFMESHYRLHNGAVLLLEAALEERPDDTVRQALTNAAAYTARHTDQTDLGLWFLHDSLEEDLDLLHRSGSRLVPSRVLGKSPANKLILNTHLDALVTLDRYREVTGDNQYAAHIASGRKTTRALLALRPAEALYRWLYRGVNLALLPPSDAQRLPLALRAVRRVAREHVLPRLHKIKRRYPRMVMPGGLVERHLGMPHYDVNYQTVNLMDLVRLWRRFPDDDFAGIVQAAVKAVHDTSLLKQWTESKQKQALGYWLEALYHLYTFTSAPEYRQYLAEGIQIAEDLGLGLPPSLLGANPETVPPDQRVPCLSPSASRIRVANLSRKGKREFLAVNCGAATVELTFEGDASDGLAWTGSDGQLRPGGSPISIAAQGWLAGIDAPTR
jgi:hypothetical protein